MHEIKFRTWDSTGTMCGPFELGDESLAYHINEGEAVEQYTGMKDTDGREIYDGDILLEQVEIDDVKPQYHFMEWYSDDAGAGWTVWPCEARMSKIVGNKHENKELWARGIYENRYRIFNRIYLQSKQNDSIGTDNH